MNSPEFKTFIQKHSSLFWYIKEDAKPNLPHEIVVEFILNFGDDKMVKELFDILGVDYVADIFYKNTMHGRRTNYLPLVINFFNYYFAKNAHRNPQQRAA